jgi:uncharacterized Ntn-hydrolase superfamily protein
VTFSLVARCTRTGQVGVGAVTAMLGVGKLVCHAQAGVGAVATQAEMNPYYGYDGLRLLSGGLVARETLDSLVSKDPGRDFRQCGIVDLAGGSAAWTGPRTPEWSGHLSGEGYSAQGNRLVGPDTLEAVVEAFRRTEGMALVDRLLEALEAGEATGADKEGALSSNITVMDTEEYPLWDLRVDHAEDPVVELRRLYEEFEQNLLPTILGLPTREDPLGKTAHEEGENTV